MQRHFKGEKLRALRKQKGITAKELGTKMGYSQSYISRFETDRATPDIDALGDMLQYLGTDIPSFFSNELEPKRRELLDTISKLSPEQTALLTKLIRSFFDFPPYNEVEK